ncbi:GntR family transcriptional regulator [Pseudoprimorskyibacter insulae]|uniref:HTH-type transcriptional regulator McbR n=1 Tax=Pseudoprimorskyibacter insulae TaxID=1695997 RepID=A0A2R8B0M3_9RHOB|nr:GntR family transcriptional regulator [Pseudoprimorskyibacter insulae]SPF81659.1 HTH-type transcriptional regulator McbR [Pseudoprimorskyibacter insulae]
MRIPETPRSEDMTTQDYAYHRLRNAVIVGAIPPGTSLTFRGIALEFGLSPTPVREAIRRLSTENAIEVLENRRLRVPEMTAGRLDELLELRVSLECHAAKRALPHLTDLQIDELQALDDDMDRSLAAGDLDALTRTNQTFHRSLYSANPDQAAVPLVESIWLQLGPFLRQVLHRIDQDGADYHKAILSALRARDAEALTRALEQDIRNGSIQAGRVLLDTPPAP